MFKIQYVVDRFLTVNLSSDLELVNFAQPLWQKHRGKYYWQRATCILNTNVLCDCLTCGMFAGITSTSLLVTSLSITADLIGQDLSNGAFIYGVMSFTDKLSNGVFVEIIQVW